jgi:uncharacterized protein (TIGR02145 family)
MTATNQACAQTKSDTNLKEEVLADRDGNKYTTKRMLDNNCWMTENLRVNIPGSYCYDNTKQHCDQYGRLYTWTAAAEGCALLGNGWELPSSEDWRHLTVLYGGQARDSLAMRKAAYQALLDNGVSEFHALLGGGRNTDGSYARIAAHGFYWASTEADKSNAWYYNFASGRQALFEQDGTEKTRAFSVRCVKKVNGSKQ